MIVNKTETKIVAGLTRKRGDIWIYNVITAKTEHRILPGNLPFIIYHNNGDYFSIKRQFLNSNVVEVSIYNISSLRNSVALMCISDGIPTFQGDLTAWNNVPTSYMIYNGIPGSAAGYALLVIIPEEQRVEIHPMTWYYVDDSYDPERTTPWDVLAVPSSTLTLISIEGAGGVVYDVATQKVVEKISLGGPGSNRRFYLRSHENEIWTLSRSVLARLNAHSLKTEDILDLNDPLRYADGKTHAPHVEFGGELSFSLDGTMCAVSRPSNKDIISVDTKRFIVTQRAVVDGEPDEVAVLNDGRVFCLDRYTRTLMQGTLRGIANINNR